jgi:hypothetical protein
MADESPRRYFKGETIYLHQLMHAVAQLRGMRPVPKSSFAEECSGVPLRIALKRPGEEYPYAIVNVSELQLIPFTAGIEAEVLLTAITPDIEPAAESELIPQYPERRARVSVESRPGNNGGST